MIFPHLRDIIPAELSLSFSFLDFFYKRLKLLPASRTDTLAEDRLAELKQEGYTFISLCGQERNFIRCQDTPIVFRELIQEGEDCENRVILVRVRVKADTD
jgi:hypothetical protein